jgi:hypothetical protein
MCVDTKGYAWERPAAKSDCAILASHFPGIDFEGLLEAMSKDSFVPMTTDMVLFAATAGLEPDEFGVRSLPLTAIPKDGSLAVVKLPVMDHIVEWFENSAMGYDMWQNVSDWSEKREETRVHFDCKCNQCIVPVETYDNGQWSQRKVQYNQSRAHLVGRAKIVRRETNSLEGLDMTPSQLMMWHRIRKCLEALPAENAVTQQQAA